ncbi:hypothetical protein EYF80_026928 [Liparis tanakae]|uniref:Uncharacterized protein n=1 Tax=Liparis tanakae TaxID=230148 RepID=A0A4Z2HCV3_9TELE|nr:hypothetical protein EYF80_026928 [Liparis tanakae]
MDGFQSLLQELSAGCQSSIVAQTKAEGPVERPAMTSPVWPSGASGCGAEPELHSLPIQRGSW